MPYKSSAQRGYFHANKELIGAKVVKEFDEASKGQRLKKEHVKPKPKKK